MNEKVAFPPIAPQLLAKLSNALKTEEGAGIGQCSVLSKKMHMYLPQSPQNIQIVQNVDAGKLFYGRTDPGQIFHLDVFHQLGEVPHRAVAARLRRLLEHYNKAAGQTPLPDADLFDLQTGTGGGRITGSLLYGNKESLKQAHKNHLHLAFSLPDAHLGLLFWIVMELEAVITEQNLELRRLEQITFTISKQSTQMDFSNYSDATDSNLRSPQPGTDTVSYRPSAQPNKHIPENLNALPSSQPPGQSSQKIPPSEGLHQQTLLPLDEKIPSTLQYKTAAVPLPPFCASVQHLLYQLKKAFVQNARSKQTPCAYQQAPFSTQTPPSPKQSCPIRHMLNLQQTIHAAAVRQLKQNQRRFSIQTEDLHFFDVQPRRQSELCLLLDTSASMCGWRMEVTKKVSEKLLSSAVRKISCISFQGQDAAVKLPFTQNRQKLQHALKNLQPSGATPLALGLETALQYLIKQKSRRPLVLLVTDGLPCYTSGNLGNPLDDALQIAHQFKKKKIRLYCIGLNQEQNYLQQLAQAAGGKAFVLPSSPFVNQKNDPYYKQPT